MPARKASDIKNAVKERYARTARRAESCCAPAAPGEASNCCGPAATRARYADALYPKEQLADLPDSVVEAAAGCGNPTALASLKPGEVVLDLGSGGGIDSFLAARQVGPAGKAIGVDMTPEMVALAQNNAARMGVTNVEFRLGELDKLPVADNSCDVIISNCVICLTPDKDAVFREAFRVLKPGGRLSISDEVSEVELPDEVKADLGHWVRCAAGALEKKDYLGKLRQAGFRVVSTTEKRHSSAPDWMADLTSITVNAVKPGRAGKRAAG